MCSKKFETKRSASWPLISSSGKMTQPILLALPKNSFMTKANQSTWRWAVGFARRANGIGKRLLDFLDKYASTMPRITLRYAIEKLDKKLKNEYMNSGK